MHERHFTPLELMLSEILSAGIIAHALDSIAHLPAFVTGGISAFGVGLALRVLDPTLRAVGFHFRARVQRAIPTLSAPPDRESDPPETPDIPDAEPAAAPGKPAE